MRKTLISILGGVDHAEYAEHAHAHENYKLLYNQSSGEAERLEQKLNDTEGNYIQAALQAEQLMERLRVAELTVARVEEERANASAGWTQEREAHLKALDTVAELMGERDRLKDELDNKPVRKYHLSTRVQPHAIDGKVGKYSLDLIFSRPEGGVSTRIVEVRTLVASQKNLTELRKILYSVNEAIRSFLDN